MSDTEELPQKRARPDDVAVAAAAEPAGISISTSTTGLEATTAPAPEAPASPPAPPAAAEAEAPAATAESEAKVEETAPVAPAKPKRVIWEFKSNLNKKDTDKKAWTQYNDAQTKHIEERYQVFRDTAKPTKKQWETKVDDTYGVHFEDMVQFRNNDRTRQRLLRRREEETA